MALPTLRAAYAKQVLNQYLVQEYNFLNETTEETLPPIPDHQESFIDDGVTTDFDQPICIVGAGPAGLSAAVMLQVIGFTNITILEATSRIGGRVYTYQFTTGPECKHNYYDVGAMRIPNIETMASTLNMIEWLNKNGESVQTAPYTFNAPDAPSWHEWPKDDTGYDDFMTKLLTKYEFLPPGPLMSAKPGSVASSKKLPTPNTFDSAFWNFVRSNDRPDRYSTRDWLMLAPRPDGPQWDYLRTIKAETFGSSTGLFDQAFMETICDWFDFAAAKDDSWLRVEGGMSVLTDALHSYATKKGVTVIKDCPVTAMQDTSETITITYTGKQEPAPPTEYAAVFSTTTFGCLQRMDLTKLHLTPENHCAIRALSYDHATKVAIKFTRPWWQDLVPDGGVSSTDLCISNVVYPSWDDGKDSAYTIIVSYTWAQDATRIAALVKDNNKESNDPTDPLMQLCFRELVKLWSKTKYPQTIEGLQSLYSAHHAFSWSREPYAAGAYALFGPGQFENLYPQFTVPLCNNKLSICGEAVSAHHAWISGAFDSSYNAIAAWCAANKYDDALKKLKESPFGQGKNKNTAEFDTKLLYWNLHLTEQRAQLDDSVKQT